MNILRLLPILCLASCTLGPTIVFNPDGTPKAATLGADVLTDADSDARQITMPTGYTMTWARSKPSQTSAVKMLGGAKIAAGLAGKLDNGVTARAANARTPTIIPGVTNSTTDPVTGITTVGNTPATVVNPAKAILGH